MLLFKFLCEKTNFVPSHKGKRDRNRFSAGVREDQSWCLERSQNRTHAVAPARSLGAQRGAADPGPQAGGTPVSTVPWVTSRVPRTACPSLEVLWCPLKVWLDSLYPSLVLKIPLSTACVFKNVSFQWSVAGVWKWDHVLCIALESWDLDTRMLHLF